MTAQPLSIVIMFVSIGLLIMVVLAYPTRPEHSGTALQQPTSSWAASISQPAIRSPGRDHLTEPVSLLSHQIFLMATMHCNGTQSNHERGPNLHKNSHGSAFHHIQRNAFPTDPTGQAIVFIFLIAFLLLMLPVLVVGAVVVMPIYLALILIFVITKLPIGIITTIKNSTMSTE